MAMSWQEIHELEIGEKYPAAIHALEERLRENPYDYEAVIRLGFNLWYAGEEAGRMGLDLPSSEYYARMMELLELYETELADNSDFCWAFGLGLHLFFYYFPGATEQMGNDLLNRARELDPFWARFRPDYKMTWWRIHIVRRLPKFFRRSLGYPFPIPHETMREAAERFRGRGIFASYYDTD
jgi:hypothetical protein